MTRGIPSTSSNYLQPFQTEEQGESSSGVMMLMVFSSQRQELREGATTDYPRARGHPPQLKQIRNLFKRAMMNSDFGTIEHLLFLDQLVTDSLAPTLHFSPFIYILIF